MRWKKDKSKLKVAHGDGDSGLRADWSVGDLEFQYILTTVVYFKTE